MTKHLVFISSVQEEFLNERREGYPQAATNRLIIGSIGS